MLLKYTSEQDTALAEMDWEDEASVERHRYSAEDLPHKHSNLIEARLVIDPNLKTKSSEIRKTTPKKTKLN